MLPKHKKRGIIAVVVFFAADVVLAGVMPEWPQIGKPFLGLALASLWFSVWSFARAKGYSSIWGVVFVALSLLGIIILIRLPDRHPRKIASRLVDAQPGVQADRP